jgi:hypothetical protein
MLHPVYSTVDVDFNQLHTASALQFFGDGDGRVDGTRRNFSKIGHFSLLKS